MANRKSGIKIGKIRIKPLGLAVIAVLLLAIIAAVVLAVIGGNGGGAAVKATPEPTAEPTREAIELKPTPTVAPTPTPVPLRSATIRAAGEIAVETDVLKAALNSETDSFDFAPMFENVAGVLGNADYTIIDVEGTMGDTQGVVGDGQRMFTPSAILTALSDAGVDMINLSNDHVLDGGTGELLATMTNIQNAGMSYVGVASSEEERNTPIVKEINGIKVGFVSYTETVNNTSADVTPESVRYLISYIPFSDAPAEVARCRQAGADVVVACVSWGTMLSRSTTESQLQIAQILSKCGVDVIIGYGPHLIQPIGWIETQKADGSGAQRTLVLCSAGNFLSNQRSQYCDSSVVLQFTVQEQVDGSFAIESPECIPTYVLRTDEGEGNYDYHVLPVGQWKEKEFDEMPAGTNYTDYQRMLTIWQEVQEIINPETAAIVAE